MKAIISHYYYCWKTETEIQCIKSDNRFVTGILSASGKTFFMYFHCKVCCTFKEKEISPWNTLTWSGIDRDEANLSFVQVLVFIYLFCIDQGQKQNVEASKWNKGLEFWKYTLVLSPSIFSILVHTEIEFSSNTVRNTQPVWIYTVVCRLHSQFPFQCANP